VLPGSEGAGEKPPSSKNFCDWILEVKASSLVKGGGHEPYCGRASDLLKFSDIFK
jgi:hypothetical protein